MPYRRPSRKSSNKSMPLHTASVRSRSPLSEDLEADLQILRERLPQTAKYVRAVLGMALAEVKRQK